MFAEEGGDNVLILCSVEGAGAVDQDSPFCEEVESIFKEAGLEFMEVGQFKLIQEPFLEILFGPFVGRVNGGGIGVAIVGFELLFLLLRQLLLLLQPALQVHLLLPKELVNMFQRAFVGTLGIDQHSIEPLPLVILDSITRNYLDSVPQPVLGYEVLHHIGSVLANFNSSDLHIWLLVSNQHRLVSRSTAQFQDLVAGLYLQALDWNRTRVVHSIEEPLFIERTVIDIHSRVYGPEVFFHLYDFLHCYFQLSCQLLSRHLDMGLNSDVARNGHSQLFFVDSPFLKELEKGGRKVVKGLGFGFGVRQHLFKLCFEDVPVNMMRSLHLNKLFADYKSQSYYR